MSPPFGDCRELIAGLGQKGRRVGKVSGVLRGGAQRLRILFRLRPSAAHACDDHLLKLLELPVQEAVNTHLFKVVTDDAAQICRQAVIGDNVDQKPAHHKKGDALNQKPLFVSAPSSILRQDRQIGRIQENGMKSAWADIGAEETAEADTVQLLLCLFRPVVIQFNAVALAVRPQGEPEQASPVPQHGSNRWPVFSAGRTRLLAEHTPH